MAGEQLASAWRNNRLPAATSGAKDPVPAIQDRHFSHEDLQSTDLMSRAVSLTNLDTATPLLPHRRGTRARDHKAPGERRRRLRHAREAAAPSLIARLAWGPPLPGHRQPPGDVSVKYPSEHERRCRHRVPPSPAPRQKQKPGAECRKGDVRQSCRSYGGVLQHSEGVGRGVFSSTCLRVAQ